MIVSCPNCEAQFAVPDEMYVVGRKARCSSCAHVFPLPEPALPQNLLEDPYQTPVVAGGDTYDNPVLPDIMGPVTKPGSSRKGLIKKLILLLLLLLLLGVIGYGGYRVYKAIWVGDAITSPTAPSDTVHEKVKSLAVENVRAQTVDKNPNIKGKDGKEGKMMVIDGKVVNNFASPKDLILLEITLFDKDSKPLAIRQQYCGVVLSYFLLQTRTQAELENALSNQVEILTNNTNIPPKGEVPFITIFFNPPEETVEFMVKAIDVQDPAPSKK